MLHVSQWLAALLSVALLSASAPVGAASPRPPGFARSSVVAGNLVLGERSRAGVLLHAQWTDDEGNPQKYFKGTKRFPWPKPLPVASDDPLTIRLDGVKYPGTLEVGVFKRTGPAAAPVGAHKRYVCPFQPSPEASCRWVPIVLDGKQVWNVEIDHVQSKGHLYIVAVGTWDDPRDPPKPLGTREQIGTWIYHAKVASR